jgi:hypothetical protein
MQKQRYDPSPQERRGKKPPPAEHRPPLVALGDDEKKVPA